MGDKTPEFEDAPAEEPREFPIYERWKAPQDADARDYPIVLGMVRKRVGALRIAKTLSIPYSRAQALRDRAWREVFVEAPTRMGPEDDAQLKDELTETLIKVVAKHDEALDSGEIAPRGELSLLSATKQLATMRGYNAPTRSVNVEWKAHALINPEVQARIMADPVLRDAFLMLEEAVSRQALAPDGDGGGP